MLHVISGGSRKFLKEEEGVAIQVCAALPKENVGGGEDPNMAKKIYLF